PREPLVFTTGPTPRSSSTSRSSFAIRTTLAKLTPSPGSRSSTTQSGRSSVSSRECHACSSTASSRAAYRRASRQPTSRRPRPAPPPRPPQRRPPHARRHPPRHALLHHRLGLDAPHVPLQHQPTVGEVRDHHARHPRVVAHHVPLGEPRPRPHHPVQVREPQTGVLHRPPTAVHRPDESCHVHRPLH